MSDAVKTSHDNSLSSMASRLAEAGVVAARGNSGMMFSHFFLGFAEGVEGILQARAEQLTVALRVAANSLYQAIEQPVEGTIITVVRELTEEAERVASHVEDLGAFGRKLLSAARESLARTPDLLPVLREANVVDAGAKGFVRFLEGGIALLEEGSTNGRGAVRAMETDALNAAAEADFPEDSDRSFQYCTEFIIRGDPPPQRAELASAVRPLGGSLIITRATTVAKIHIHTNEPDSVTAVLEELGSQVELVKAEDMRAQHRKLRARSRPKVAVLTDTTCDLPPDAIIEHDITLVPLTVMFGDEAYLDQVDIAHEEFMQRLIDPAQPHPTTSQPAPAHFHDAFKRAAEEADDVVAILVSGALSGTLRQGQAAATRFTASKIHVFDSRTASLGLGFQVLKAVEMAREGKEASEIIDELNRIQLRSGIFLTVDTFEYLQRSGRVGRARAFLGGLLDLKPVLGLDSSGAIKPVAKVRGQEALRSRVVELVCQQIPKDRKRLRIGVVHVMCPDVAEELKSALENELQPDETWVRPVTAVLAAHTGPGAWAVAYQVE